MSCLISSTHNSYSKISAVLFSFAILLSALCAVDAEIIRVCPEGCDYSNISAGISAADPGDIVEVQSGNYAENLIVDKSITLRGANTGSGMPLIDAGNSAIGIKLIADGITIEGFRVNNSDGFWSDTGAGIEVSSSNNTIINNTIAENEHGILVDSFGNNTLAANSLSDNEYAIKVESSAGNRVIGNHVDGNGFGILLVSATNNDLLDNDVAWGDYGILLNSSSNNLLRDNLVHDNSYNFGAEGNNDVDASNLADSRPIVYLLGATNATIDESSKAGAVYCLNCSNISIKGLHLENNIFGVYLFNSTRCLIENISSANNSYGIRLDASDENFIRNNSFIDNHIVGISITRSNHNLVYGNELRGNEQAGLDLDSSDDSNITANEFVQNNLGLAMAGSGFNSISGNDFSQNADSNLLLTEHSYNNSIYENSLTGSLDAIVMDSSMMNEISRNIIDYNSNGIFISGGNKNKISENSISNNDLGLSYVIFSEFAENGNQWLNNSEKISEIPPETTKSPPGGSSSFNEDESEVAVVIDPTLLKAIAYLDEECLGTKKTTKYYLASNDEEHNIEMRKDETVVFKKTFKVSDSKEALIVIRPEKED